MNRTIKYAGVAGILSLLSLIPITFFEILISLNKLDGGLVVVYASILFLSLAAYTVYAWGFIIIAEKYQNNLLKISSYVAMISSMMYCLYVVLVLFFPNLENVAVHPSMLIVSGAASIFFGIAVLKLKPQFGSLATGSGVVEIIAGASLLSLIFSIIGMLLVVPVTILGSMILFRAAKSQS